MKCHYEVFGLERDVTADEIKKQYKKLVLKYHPDKNVGNEEAATQAFKEIQASYAVLGDPHERKWYDDHRESILRGGTGPGGSDFECADSPLINLWKYFNTGCYSGFDDENPQSFYHVYGNLFYEIHQIDFKEQQRIAEIVQFGNSLTSTTQIIAFYSHWTNFVTVLSFSWVDKYNTTEAPNRLVKRAMEKENRKLRDAAKKKYIETVRELATYVRRRDPRIVKIESEKKKREEEEALKRIQFKNEEKERKRLQREKWRSYQETDEEREAREKERKGVFLFANEEEKMNEKDRKKKLFYGDKEIQEGEGEGEKGKEAATDNPSSEDGNLKKTNEEFELIPDDIQDFEEEEEEEVEEYFILRCEICRKDFKVESQLQQHLASKLHKKKVQEINKKFSKKKNSKAKAAAAAASQQKMSSIDQGSLSDEDEDDEENDNEEIAQENIEVSQFNKQEHGDEDEKEVQQEQQEDSENDEVEFLNRLTQSVEINHTSLSSSDDSDSDSDSEGDVKEKPEKEETKITPTPATVPSREPKKKKGKKINSKPIGDQSEGSAAQDIYPEEFDELHEKDEKQNKICKVCGLVASSKNKLFQHIQQTGHAATKEVSHGEETATATEMKKKKKGKNRK